MYCTQSNGWYWFKGKGKYWREKPQFINANSVEGQSTVIVRVKKNVFSLLFGVATSWIPNNKCKWLNCRCVAFTFLFSWASDAKTHLRRVHTVDEYSFAEVLFHTIVSCYKVYFFVSTNRKTINILTLEVGSLKRIDLSQLLLGCEISTFFRREFSHFNNAF